MDNLRFILIVALSLVSLMLWQEWQQDYGVVAERAGSTPAENRDITRQEDDSDAPAIPDTPAPQAQPLSALQDIIPPESGDFIVAETDVYRLRINKTGGGIHRLELLDYPVSLEEKHRPTVLLDDTAPMFFVVQGGLLSRSGGPVHEAKYTAARATYTLEAGQNKLIVPLIWESEEGLKVTKIYEFTRSSYLINTRYRIENRSDEAWSGHAYGQLQRNDPGRDSYLLYTYTGAVLSSPDKRYQKIRFDEIKDEQISVDIPDGWAAMLQHYFVAALIPSTRAEDYRYYTDAHREDRYIIGAITPAHTIAPHTSGVIEHKIYLGPKIQSELKKIAPGLELTVDYGFFWLLAYPLFWCLKQFHGLTGNWGWAIVLITVALKLVFFRLSAAGYKSMANMRRIHPRLVAIKERYKNDRQRLHQAMMDLYKKEKIRPFGGCFPIIIQIPVFIALYWALLESVELRQAEFIFWITDLSSPDRYFVLPLIMGATMLIQQKLNPAPIDPVQEKIMMILPLVFTVFFAFFPSGLVLYWVVNNVLSIGQQWIITREIERAAATK